jgi:hypothetical protein
MRALILSFLLLVGIFGKTQDFLSVPLSQPAQWGQLSPNNEKSLLQDSMIYLFDARDIPFRDDFTRNQLKELNATPADAGVFDTTFYRLFIGNQVVDTADRFTNFTTKRYRFGTDSLPIDTTDLPTVQLTVNDFSQYPLRQEVITVFPAYNIFDTVGSTPDTVFVQFLFQQDSVLRYIVPPSGNALWQNDNVLINDDYAWNPPSYGVATFDGLNREGRAYDNGSLNTYGETDFLTSVPFNIGYLQEADSVFLSFWYQPQGAGRDAPESEDSLVLEFFNPTQKQWQFAWGVRGTARAPFKQELILLSDTYLQDNFQFRFKAKGNRSGAYDIWNIDHVYLDRGRNQNDTTSTDIGIGRTYTSMLKEYSSVPFWQYAALTSALMKDTASMLIVNNTTTSRTTAFRYFIEDPDGIYYPEFPFPANLNTSISVPGNGFENWELPLLNAPVNFSYPVADMDTAHTYVTSFIAKLSNLSGGDDFPLNDTLYHEQRFDHYLAYDNGSAEAGYGVNVTDTTFGKRALIAQEFTTLVDDTLNAISFYFLPQGLDLEGAKFNLCVWKDLTPTGLIYRKPAVDQVYYGAKNGFLTYLLDTSIVISGTFYVGFEQQTQRSLNVGYDFKNDRKSKLFYSIDGGASFLNASAAIQPGTAMIRPYFRVDNNQVSTVELIQEEMDFIIYPNPTRGAITVQINNKKENFKVDLTVFDLQGRQLIEKSIKQPNAQLDLTNLDNGLYFIRLSGLNGSVKTKRIIVSH